MVRTVTNVVVAHTMGSEQIAASSSPVVWVR